MTAQFQEEIFIDGEYHGLSTEPLQMYLDSMQNPPEFDWGSTACWRGYVGSWAIKGNSLYLTDIQLQCVKEDNFHWRMMFNGRQGDIKAEWFSGVLRVPQGELLEYVHGGYGSQYERDLFIDIEKGNIIDRRIVHNGTD